ncbi:TraB/VirB10 family protein [Rickettsiales bacterium]|nr:TraB/VirB10 family protein [Rickettsiales bacterium]
MAKLTSLTNSYKNHLKGKSFIIIGMISFFLIMSIYIVSDDNDKIYKKGQIKVDLDKTFSDNDNTIKIALEGRVEELERDARKKDKAHLQLLKDIASGKIAIPSLDALEEKVSDLENNNSGKKEKINNQEKLKKPKESKENIIYKYSKDPLITEHGIQQFPKNNFYKNVNNPNINNQPIENITIANNEIEMVVFNNNSDFDVNEYLPAGSIASAKLLSSVDVGVGVTSQSEPRPVLLRVTSHAFSSADKEDLNLKNKTDIRGCTLTGEASGDLSSERGYIRLIKMTCNSDDSKVTESDVYGYVSSFGKAGIRGLVIEKEGDLVAKSFMSGILANLGKSIEQRYQSDTSINGAVATVTRSTSDIAKSGMGSGFGSALDRLSDYYIKKMEQIEPVISIGQGLDVEVIFYKGSFIDGRKSNEVINKKL